MKWRVLVTILFLGSLTCETGPDHAQAERSKDPGHGELTPTQTPAAKVWQASYASEASGNLPDALSALTKLPSPQRESYLASYRRGWLLYRLGRYAESAAAYQVAIGLQPAGVEARVAALAPLMALTKWQDVMLVAQELLKRDPENYMGLSRLAFAKYSLERYAEAEVVYRELVKLYPADVEMLSALGWVVLRMHKNTDAADLFARVLEVSPAHVGAAAGYREATGSHKAKH